MRRRDLVLLAAGMAVARARTADASQDPPVVAFMGFASPEGDRITLEALREGLRTLGHVDGRTLVVESRHASGDLQLAAREIEAFARRPVAVFLAPGPAAARAIRRVTAIPVVAIGLPAGGAGTDLFASLARPGGTVTGFSNFGEELSAKRIEILREALPGTQVIGILHNATDPVFREWGEQTEDSARAQGLRPMRLGVRSLSPTDLGALLRSLKDAGGDTLIVIRDFLTTPLRDEICRQALDLRIAVVAEVAEFVPAGALMSYGPDIPDLFRRAATYVDRIIKGEKPGDLPIQLPTKFELAVNLDTARRLGHVLPTSIILRADRVVE
jgi:putative ABC transport system substrate-binding protein